ncbi:MAG: DUF2752 domain-containing protein [Bacteroidales bacterium]|jgi:hypothetical protein|nr:DUF2752 domain-containing protein [Bacteroidales bacterium]
MENHLKKAKQLYPIIIAYLKRHFILVIVAAYYLIALTLYIFAKIDVLIPCLWKTIFNVKCPGCGLTTAFINLLSFDFSAAWKSNPLIFIVLPGLTYYIIRDFILFIKNNK